MKSIGYSLLFMLFFANLAKGQYVPEPKIEAEVNQQIWKPFKQSYEAKDWRTFNELHSDDVLRISKWSGIKIGQEYKDRKRISYSKSTKRKQTIDLRFEHRIYSENVGYEVGYYRVIYDEPGKDRLITYSQFHVVVKKVNGIWKIAQDWDTDTINGNKVTEEDFAKGTPISF